MSSSEHMSDEQLAEIEQRADAATPDLILGEEFGWRGQQFWTLETASGPTADVCEGVSKESDAVLFQCARQDVLLLVRALRDARDEMAREPIRTAIEYDHWRDAAIANRNEADSLRAAIEHALAAADGERDALRTENERLRTTLGRAATGLESVLAGRPVRNADEVLIATRSALAAPTEGPNGYIEWLRARRPTAAPTGQEQNDD